MAKPFWPRFLINPVWSIPPNEYLLVKLFWPTLSDKSLLANPCWPKPNFLSQFFLANSFWQIPFDHRFSDQPCLVDLVWAICCQTVLVNHFWPFLCCYSVLAHPFWPKLSGHHFLSILSNRSLLADFLSKMFGHSFPVNCLAYLF